MKFYNINKLYLAANKKNFLVVKTTYYSFEYKDILSGKTYHEHDISIGGSLPSFVVKHPVNAPIMDKVLKIAQKGSYISKKTINELVLFLNSDPKNHDYNYTTNKIEVKKSKINMGYIKQQINKKYKLSPLIGRSDETALLNVYLAANKKCPILKGNLGVGKTTIIEGLKYDIKKNDAPDFLKKRKIIELNLNRLLIDTNYDKLIEIINLAIKNNSIILIEDIDLIENNDNIKSLLIDCIQDYNLKIIGTTNNNMESFNNNYFKVIPVEEPDSKLLKNIIIKTFTDYSKSTNIKIPDYNLIDMVSETLIELTKYENRILNNNKNLTYTKDISNPGFVIDIIDRIFAEAMAKNKNTITISDILHTIDNFDNIDNAAKKEARNKMVYVIKFH